MAATKSTKVTNASNSIKSNKSAQYNKITKINLPSNIRKLVGSKPRAQMASRTARRTSGGNRARSDLHGLHSAMHSFKEKSTKAVYKNESDLSRALDGLSLTTPNYNKTVRFDLNKITHSASSKSLVHSDGSYNTTYPPEIPGARESGTGYTPVTAMPHIFDGLTNSVNNMSLKGAGEPTAGQKKTRDMVEMGLVSKEEVREQARRAWDNIDVRDIDGIRELANTQSQEIGDEYMDWSVIPDFA